MNKGIIFPVIFRGSGDTYGYRWTGENLIKGLTKKGIDVIIPESKEFGNDYSFTNDKELLNILKKPFKEYDKVLILLTAAHEEFYNQISSYLGKDKYLFTMWEYNKIPEIFENNLFFADKIIVPSNHNKRLFKRYFPNKEIYNCPLGYNNNIKFKERKIKDRFRFLWVGAPSSRKGWYLVGKAFQEVFRPYEPVELYIKTSPNEDGREMKTKLHEKVIFDCRRVPFNELLDIYYSSHCFVFPSIGEGFGLTPLEAIVSGLITICPAHTGMADFISDKTAIKLDFKEKYVDFESDWTAKAPVPKLEDLKRKMREVYRNYENIYSRLFPYASNYLSEKYTWDNSCQTLIDIMWDKNENKF